jgi:hypothetical protein
LMRALERTCSGTSGMLAQAVTGALDLDDDGVVQEPVEERGSDHRVAEDLAPLGKAPVGGEDHRAPFIASIDQLEEQTAAIGEDRQVADLIDDQECGAAEEANLVAQPALVLGLGERGDEVGKRDEVDAAAGPDRLDPEGNRKMALARAGRSSVILPGVWRLKFGSSTRFIRAGARRSSSSVRSATRAASISSSDSPIGPWPFCQHG